VDEGVAFPLQNRFLARLAPMRRDVVTRQKSPRRGLEDRRVYEPILKARRVFAT